MSNSFVNSLFEKIDNYNSFDRKRQYNKNIIDGIVRDFNDISPSIESEIFKLFEFQFQSFEVSEKLKNVYILNIKFYYEGDLTEDFSIGLDIFNDNNYKIIFDRLFDVLLSYKRIYDMITNVKFNKNDDNPFRVYLKNNSKYFIDNPDNIEECNYEQSY